MASFFQSGLIIHVKMLLKYHLSLLRSMLIILYRRFTFLKKSSKNWMEFFKSKLWSQSFTALCKLSAVFWQKLHNIAPRDVFLNHTLPPSAPPHAPTPPPSLGVGWRNGTTAAQGGERDHLAANAARGASGVHRRLHARPVQKRWLAMRHRKMKNW